MFAPTLAIKVVIGINIKNAGIFINPILKGKLASKKDPEDFEYLNVYAVAAGRSVADVHLHTKLMETNKVPFNLENSRPDLKSAKAGIKT